jgi:UrcA family protein
MDMSKARAILLAAALAMGAQVAQATDSVAVGEVRLSETVKYGDLNLNREEGVSRLYKRLNRAAKNVCEPLRGRQLMESAKHRVCVSEALANAVAEVNQPLLTQYYHSKGESSSTAIVAKR